MIRLLAGTGWCFAMRARFSYPLAFLVPSAMAAVLLAVLVAAAGAGILWLFVFGDNPWPAGADGALMALAAFVAAGALMLLLLASYSFGKRRETYGGMAKRHLVLALAVSIAIPALVLFYEWQVGNLGPGPVPANNSFKPTPRHGSLNPAVRPVINLRAAHDQKAIDAWQLQSLLLWLHS